MARDPYGFPERDDPASGARAAEARGTDPASVALWCGVGSALCSALAPCACYAPSLPAVALGVYAVVAGMRLVRAAPDRPTRTMADAAVAAGAGGALVGLVMITFLLGYLALFAFAFGAAALDAAP